MNPLILSLIASVLQKVIPDPAAAAAAQLEAAKLAQSGALAEMDAVKALALAQTDINKADAQSADPFQRRWRPMIGYVCGVVLAWDCLLKPMLGTAYVLMGHPLPELPNLGDTQIYGLMFSLLGLGGLRTIEKVKGAA